MLGLCVKELTVPKPYPFQFYSDNRQQMNGFYKRKKEKMPVTLIVFFSYPHVVAKSLLPQGC